MADDRRVYSDEEFALVLRKAAELASRPDAPPSASAGLTLAEMKAAAAQAGIDPALVERAARLLGSASAPSPVERLTGGPLRHEQSARFPIALDEDRAARLLSAVRISASVAGSQDVGHSGVTGMTWHDGGDVEALRITARPEGDGTSVSVSLDRRGTLGMVGVFSGVSLLLTTLFAGSALYPEAPALGIGGFIVGAGGVLAVARGYWASSTRKARERIGAVMDAIEQTLNKPAIGDVGIRGIGDGAAALERDPDVAGDAELKGA